MKTVLAIIVLALLLTFGIFAYRKNVSQTSKPSPTKFSGQALDQKTAAVDFELKDLEGNTVRLESFKGQKPVVINFWASWCPFCQEELSGSFSEFYLKDGGKDKVEILAINLQEDRETARDTALAWQLPFPVLLDSDGKVFNIYNAVMPSTFIIDKNGFLRKVFPGAITKELLIQAVDGVIKEN